MTDLLLLLGAGAGSFYLLWVLYLAVMNAARARDAGTLTKPALALAMPVLGLGYLLDALVNLTVCTVLFLELPREVLVTGRVSRLQKGTGKRAAIARWMCANLLDPFDPSGCHCK